MRRLRNFAFNLRRLVRQARLRQLRARPAARPPPGPPRVEYSYTIFWTKHVRQWDAARRAQVQAALAQAVAQPGFVANDYERRYRVPGLDDQAHAGASLVALSKVLEAFEERSMTDS